MGGCIGAFLVLSKRFLHTINGDPSNEPDVVLGRS